MLLWRQAVSGISVIGKPSPNGVKVCRHSVVAAPDCQVKAEELDQLCLTRFKRPNEYSFLDALPKNN